MKSRKYDSGPKTRIYIGNLSYKTKIRILEVIFLN